MSGHKLLNIFDKVSIKKKGTSLSNIKIGLAKYATNYIYESAWSLNVLNLTGMVTNNNLNW